MVGLPFLCMPILPSQVMLGAYLMRMGAIVAMVDHLAPTMEQDIEAGVR
jgi:hypothetical protein